MNPTPEDLYRQLCQHVRETALLASLEELAGWDERTYLPTAASAFRADQMTILAGMVHRRRTAPQLGEWLEILADSDLAADPHSDTGTTIRKLRRDYQKRTRLPATLVEQLAHATALGQHAWLQARQSDQYAVFQPHLESIVRLKREEADAIGTTTCRYDALLDDYEPDATTAGVDGVLTALRRELVPMVAEAADSRRQPDPSVLRRDFPVATQADFATAAARQIGFNFARGRLDITHHPFCASLGPHDCRITTRYDAHFFPGAFFGVLHEAGHGLYEQGLRSDLYGLPPGTPTSLGIHESQSRLWENQVGRSREFWQHFFPLAQQAFPAALADVKLEVFHAALNQVSRSLIRVEADEATYNLHIVIRFELERALLDGDLAVRDLPGAWRDRYTEDLGVTPPTDANGVLQDIHWSAGLFGYFPTYSLGNLCAAQFFEQALRDVPDLREQIATGQFGELLGWLRQSVHQYGQCYSATELVQRVTGEALSPRAFLKYLRHKLAPLYDLQL